MPEAPENTKSAAVRNVVDRLRRPIPDLPTLLALLSGPLDSLSLLPTKFRRYNTEPLLSDSVHVLKQIPSFQRALLDYIAPTWDTLLAEEDAIMLLDQFFCPISFALPAAVSVVLQAYTSISSQPLTEYGINILARMTTEYPVDRLHGAFFSRKDRSKAMLEWEDYVRNIVAVPAKVANAAAGKANIPPLLEHGSYFNNLCLRCESLVFLLSTQNEEGASQSRYAGVLIDCIVIRCSTFSVLPTSETYKSGSLPHHAPDISFATLLLPNYPSHNSYSSGGRSL